MLGVERTVSIQKVMNKVMCLLLLGGFSLFVQAEGLASIPKDLDGNRLVIGQTYLMTAYGLDLQKSSKKNNLDNKIKSKSMLKLTKTEAAKLVRKRFKLPDAVSTSISYKITTPGADFLQKMINDHKLKPKGKENLGWGRTVYLPTAKNKGYVKSIVRMQTHRDDPSKTYYDFKGAVVKVDIKSMEEVLIDEKRGYATVKFELAYQKILPIYESLCIDSTCKFFGDKLNKTWKRTVTFKKYDKGWRVY